MRHIVSILLENEAGALSRVAGLFSARGYNIEALTVAPTEDPTLSRMTLRAVTDDGDLSAPDEGEIGILIVVEVDRHRYSFGIILNYKL